MSYLSQMDRGCDVAEQVFLQKTLATLRQGLESGRQDQLLEKQKYDRMLLSDNYKEIKYYAVELDGYFPLMCSGCISPSYDFQGKRLQNLANLNERCDSLSLSVIGNDEGHGLIIFAWIGNREDAGESLARSYNELSDYQKCQSIVRFIFEFLENKYLNPTWWDRLSSDTKSVLYKRQEVGINPFLRRKPDCLKDDGNHYVDCIVINIHTNIKI